MFNEEMTSKIQPVTVVLVVEKKMADISLVSRVRTTAGWRHLLLGEYLRSWTNLNVHYRLL